MRYELRTLDGTVIDRAADKRTALHALVEVREIQGGGFNWTTRAIQVIDTQENTVIAEQTSQRARRARGVPRFVFYLP